MKKGTLLVFNFGGGDLTFKLVDDIATKYIDNIKFIDVYQYTLAVGEYFNPEVYDGHPCGEGVSHILSTIYVSNIVTKDLPEDIVVSRIIYFHDF